MHVFLTNNKSKFLENEVHKDPDNGIGSKLFEEFFVIGVDA